VLRDIRSRWRDRSAADVVRPREQLSPAELEQLGSTLEACLSARGGEVSAWERAADVAETYLALGPGGRRAFLSLLAARFGAAPEPAVEAAQRVVEADGPRERDEALLAARTALEPRWIRLLTQFNNLVGGTKFLVDLRADLLPLAAGDPRLSALEQDLRHLLAASFGAGQLELRRITWDSPASLLERLAASEAVHEVTSWDDLKNRLDVDRRFFAFFHPQMPDEPLVFVEVALTRELAHSIEPLLDPAADRLDPAEAEVAIFYSISNSQPGLAGISLGGFLIKQVVDELKDELQRLRTFATLSPIPGLRRWLDRVIGDPRLPIGEEERAAVASVLRRAAAPADGAVDAAREPLLQLCAHYLLNARRPDGLALDPVANFHLTNGARVERLNWLADPSAKGWQASLGLMVNYRYQLKEIERNHEAYATDGTIAAGAAVTGLANALA
jgi:malonyl-CoA decarboxylase